MIKKLLWRPLNNHGFSLKYASEELKKDKEVDLESINLDSEL